MSTVIFDIEQLYQKTFGSKPFMGIPPKEETPVVPTGKYAISQQFVDVSQISGSQLRDQYQGKEIWLPVKFTGLDTNKFGTAELLLPYSVIRIAGKKTIVKTPMADRQGTVKELYSIDDYSISIKGFLIDDAKRVWPEKELITLKKLFELNQAVRLDNALTNIFLDKDQRVIIESFDLPEVEGGRKHVRPFSMNLESDSVFTLELE